MSDANANMVPLVSLSGADLTRAVRNWAISEGIEVGARGAVAPELVARAVLANPDVPAPKVKAKRAPAAPKVPNVYDIHVNDGQIITVEGGRGKATLDRVAERAGVDVGEIERVTRGGEAVDLPRRKAVGGPSVWSVHLRNGQIKEYTNSGRGRITVAKVAEGLGIKPSSIEYMTDGENVKRVQLAFNFSDADEDTNTED